MRSPTYRLSSSAFSLVEIMIVLTLIGLLAALAVPAVQKIKNRAAVSAFVNDLRAIEKATEVYAMEMGVMLQDYETGEQPADLIPYLKNPDFTGNTQLGGQWDWDNHNTYYRISVIPMDEEIVRLVDEEIDDGNTGTGLVQFSGGFRYYTWNAP
ncbi:MAG: hypothetical protein SynsKO_36470 [Synoicihabitans sp.]